MDSFRSSLSPNIVEALICTKNWLKDAKKKRLVKLRECMDNVEEDPSIVEIASICLMPMEEDPSIVVLDDDE